MTCLIAGPLAMAAERSRVDYTSPTARWRAFGSSTAGERRPQVMWQNVNKTQQIGGPPVVVVGGEDQKQVHGEGGGRPGTKPDKRGPPPGRPLPGRSVPGW